jgi:hypothetical protein
LETVLRTLASLTPRSRPAPDVAEPARDRALVDRSSGAAAAATMDPAGSDRRVRTSVHG